MYVVKVPGIKSKPSKHQKVHTGENSYDSGKCEKPLISKSHCSVYHRTHSGGVPEHVVYVRNPSASHHCASEKTHRANTAKVKNEECPSAGKYQRTREN